MKTLLTDRIIFLADEIKDKRNATLKQFGLSPGQDDFLFALLKENGMTMGMLAKTLSLRAPLTAKTAAKLEQKDLIKRTSSKLDSRRQHANLTEKGNKVALGLVEQFEIIDQSYSKLLKPKSIERLEKIIEKLNFSTGKKKPAAKKPKKAGKSLKQATQSKKKNKAKKKK